MTLDINNIMDYIPHRYPFLLIDRVISVEWNKRIIGLKNVTINEPFFTGHFPESPVMPGVLMIEAMAQLSGVLILSTPETKGKIAYFASADKVKWRRPVIPGDQLRMEVDLLKTRGPVAKCRGKCLVDGKIVCESIMTFSLGDSKLQKRIDPTAQIHPNAEIGKNVTVGSNAFIGEGVKIGNSVIIEANVVIEKWVTIGDNTHIHYGAIIGNTTQDKKFRGERSYVEIGKNCDIREYVTINRATAKEGLTKIGDNCLLLTMVHIGHDCILGNNIIISNTAGIAGHVEIGDNVVIGGMAGITQFCRIGKLAMIGGYSKVNQDVPPFMLVEGNPATIRTLNIIGMERNNILKPAQKSLKEAYKKLFRSKMNLSQAIENTKNEISNCSELEYLLTFITSESKTGIMKNIKKRGGTENESTD